MILKCMSNSWRSIYVQWLVWRGKAIDIWSSDYPSGVLSNLANNAFVFDGVECLSMEGFLQSLKYSNPKEQKAICFLKGKKAKAKAINNAWKLDQKVYWQGTVIDRSSGDFQQLLRRAYQALFEQNETFRTALLLTGSKKLYHVRGKSNPRDTILTEKEFCQILTELRDAQPYVSKDVDSFICHRKNCIFRKLC